MSGSDDKPKSHGPAAAVPASAAAAPFPYLAILTLCICSFATAMNQMMMMPIAPFYIYDAGMVSDPREPGVYAG